MQADLRVKLDIQKERRICATAIIEDVVGAEAVDGWTRLLVI
jgi:hypothetical protein